MKKLIKTCSALLQATQRYMQIRQITTDYDQVNNPFMKDSMHTSSLSPCLAQTLGMLLFCLTASFQPSFAVEVNHLYEAEVIAKSHLKKDKALAIKQAMEIVLTRILAGDNILQNKTVQVILSAPEKYLSEFQYALTHSNSPRNNSARLIRVLFNEKMLVDILRSNHLQFWNEIRSKTLIWLVVEDQGRQRFFDSNSMPEVDAAMQYAAKQKALPVLYPIQDLKETQQLSTSDVLSAYSDHLLDVSLRYDVVSTLAGKMVKKGSCWQAEWTLYFDEKIEQWNSQCGFINHTALSGFQGVFERLSNYYAIQSNRQKIVSTVIKIANINNTSTLENVSNYLESLPMVSTATWMGNEEKYNLYRIFFQGKPDQLSKNLAKDEVLIVENSATQSNDRLTYQLISELY